MSYTRPDKKAETIVQSDGETIWAQFHLVRGCHGLSYSRGTWTLVAHRSEADQMRVQTSTTEPGHVDCWTATKVEHRQCCRNNRQFTRDGPWSAELIEDQARGSTLNVVIHHTSSIAWKPQGVAAIDQDIRRFRHDGHGGVDGSSAYEDRHSRPSLRPSKTA